MMATIRLDRMLAVDTESTCWDGPPPPGEESEVIEIGICEIDTVSLSVTRSRSYLIRPYRSSVSDFCTNLTGHTEAALKSKGRRFSEVANSIRKEFGSAAKSWIAWGRDDETIARECAENAAANPFPGHFINAGLLWSVISGADRNVGMAEALETMGIDRDGRAHNGGDDAANLAKLMISIISLQRCALPSRAMPSLG